MNEDKECLSKKEKECLSKKEIADFIRENLEISISIDKFDGDVIVMLLLNGEVISKSFG